MLALPGALFAQTAHVIATQRVILRDLAIGSASNGPDIASGVAVDSHGNVFIADEGSTAIQEILAAGGYVTVNNLAQGSFNGPHGVAVDGSGNVFVADENDNAVKEILAAGGYTTVNTLGSGFNAPTGVAVDGSGNVFVADENDNSVKEILAASGYTTVNTLAIAFAEPTGVAVDGSGNVFVADVGGGVQEIFLAGGYTSGKSLGSGLSAPTGVAVDGSGNVFVADTGNNAVKEIAASGYTRTLGSGFNAPTGVAVDASGNVFVADEKNNSVKEILAASGYSTVNTLISNFYAPSSVTLNGMGNLFIVTTDNNSVYKLDFADPPTVTFTSTALGATSSDSPQTVTLTNSGNATLTFPVPSTGLNPAISVGFTLGVSSTCPLLSTASSAGTLAAGVSCTDILSFAPNLVGSISGSLAITDDTLNVLAPGYATQNIALSGTAIVGGVDTPTLTFAVPNHTYGDASFSVTATSNSTGAFIYAVVSGPATVAGNIVSLTDSGTVVLTASQSASGNYAAATITATFTVVPSVMLSSGSNSPSETVAPGAAVTYTLSFAPGGQSTYPNELTFAVTGLPAGTTAVFSLATIPAGSGAASLTLTIQTAQTNTGAYRKERHLPTAPCAPVVLGILLLPWAALRPVRRRLRGMPILAMLALSMGVVVDLSGCGGGSTSTTTTSTPSQSYTLTVTATDAVTGLHSATSLTLVVQQAGAFARREWQLPLRSRCSA